MNDSLGFRLNAPRRSDAVVWRNHERVIADISRVFASAHADPLWRVRIGDTTHRLEVDASLYASRVQSGERSLSFLTDDDGVTVFENGNAQRFERRVSSAATGPASDGSLRAPMPGKVVAVPVKAGDPVKKGQAVVVIEAMKMEQALTAPYDGVVASIGFNVGDQVGADAVLAVVTARDE